MSTLPHVINTFRTAMADLQDTLATAPQSLPRDTADHVAAQAADIARALNHVGTWMSTAGPNPTDTDLAAATTVLNDATTAIARLRDYLRSIPTE